MYVCQRPSQNETILSTVTDSSDDPFSADLGGFGSQLPVEAQPPAAAHAAVALTQLHDWPSDFVSTCCYTVSARTRELIVNLGRLRRCRSQTRT